MTLKLFNLQFGLRIDANGSNKYAFTPWTSWPAWEPAEPFAFAFLSYIRVVRANLMQNFPRGETFPRHSEFQAISPWLFFPIFVNNYGVYGPRFLRFVFSLGKRRFTRVSPGAQRNSFRKLSRPTSLQFPLDNFSFHPANRLASDFALRNILRSLIRHLVCLCVKIYENHSQRSRDVANREPNGQRVGEGETKIRS